VGTKEAQMRLVAAVASVIAVVLALILLVRGRPLVDRRPTDPRMIRALAVCILAISLSTLAGYQLDAWGITYALGALGVIALITALVFAGRTDRR
jgi:hypothetical protein